MNELIIENVVEKYKELKTLKAVAKHFNIHPESIRKFFVKNNLPYNKTIKYYHDENFFATDTENSFYWAGFIAADGNISKEKDFNLTLKKDDYQHILKFKTAVGSDAPIIFGKPEKMIICGIATTHTGSATIRFRAKKWSEDLKRFNIVPNKTKTYTIPQTILKHPLFKHFIRGYFEGDGWFSQSIDPKSRNSRIAWGLCGNLPVMGDIQNHLIEQLSLSNKPKIYRQKNIYKFQHGKMHDVLLITNYIYGDATVFLDRKYTISKLVKDIDDNTVILNIDKSKLEETYYKLRSIALTANELGCCKNSIYNYMKKYGIKLL